MQALIAQHQQDMQGASDGCLVVPIDVHELMTDAPDLGELLLHQPSKWSAMHGMPAHKVAHVPVAR